VTTRVRTVVGAGVAVAMVGVWVASVAAQPPRGSGGPPLTPELRERMRKAQEEMAKRRVMERPNPNFPPEAPITRGELAITLARLVQHLENSGPVRAAKAGDPKKIQPYQLTALAKLPKSHRATPAMTRLVKGGYIIKARDHRVFLPTPQNIDKPVGPKETATAISGVVLRVMEKQTEVAHPDQKENADIPEVHE
jgi:hypothetical protein